MFPAIVGHPSPAWIQLIGVIGVLLSGLGIPLDAVEPPTDQSKVLFDFDGPAAATAWETAKGALVEITPVAGENVAGTDAPSRQALRLYLPKGTWAKSKPASVPRDWTKFSDLTFWAYRDPVTAKGQPLASLDVRLWATDGAGFYRRRVDLTHAGWRRIVLPLRWFRAGDNRVPAWDHLSQIEFLSHDSVELTIDAARVTAGRESGPFVTPDDIRKLAFPGTPEKAIQSEVSPDLCVMTNEPALDAAKLAAHLREVAAKVTKDLDLPKPPAGRRATLLVFATRRQFQDFPTGLAEKLNADPVRPAADGFTTGAVAASSWDPVAGEKRPVFTHEFVHSLVELSLGVSNRGDWLQEGFATYYQLQFHPQAKFAEFVRDQFAAGVVPLSKLCGGPPVPAGKYWQVATLCEMLLTDPKYKSKLPALLALLAKSETTDLAPHLQSAFKITWDGLERDWTVFCDARYQIPIDGVAAKDRPALPAGTTVHGVGVSQPWSAGFTLGEVDDWPGFAALLSAGQNGKPAHRVWTALTAETRTILSDPARTAALRSVPAGVTADGLLKMVADRRAVKAGFTRLLNTETLYDPAVWAGSPVGRQALDLWRKGDKRSELDTRLLNRLALRAAFADRIAQEPADPAEVVVTVKAGGPVVLVLTANESCNWVVKPDAGARIAWVILSGYHYQQVSGVTCPVARVGHRRPADDHYADYLHTPDESDRERPEYVRRVTALTGRRPDSFQRAGSYSGLPFVVPAVK